MIYTNYFAMYVGQSLLKAVVGCLGHQKCPLPVTKDQGPSPWCRLSPWAVSQTNQSCQKINGGIIVSPAQSSSSPSAFPLAFASASAFGPQFAASNRSLLPTSGDRQPATIIIGNFIMPLAIGLSGGRSGWCCGCPQWVVVHVTHSQCVVTHVVALGSCHPKRSERVTKQQLLSSGCSNRDLKNIIQIVNRFNFKNILICPSNLFSSQKKNNKPIKLLFHWQIYLISIRLAQEKKVSEFQC